MDYKKILKGIIVFTLMIASLLSGILAAKIVNNTKLDPGTPGDEIDIVDKKTGKINILVMGTDKDELRTDVLLLVGIDNDNQALNILSIPRDTRVKIGSSYQKINAAYAIKKEELSLKVVKELTGVPINYYAVINFQAFRDIIDILGGVEYNVPIDMKYDDPYQDLHINLKKGQQRLNGEQAEGLVRFRHTYRMGDLDRITLQQDFIRELIRQKLRPQYVIKIPQVFSKLTENMKTNLKMSDFIKIGKDVLDIPEENIKTVTLPGYTDTIGGSSYYICDREQTRQLIEKTFLK